MGFFDQPVRDLVTKTARPGLLQLMRNHSSGFSDTATLLEAVDAYLKLNPHDAEIREGRELLVGTGAEVGA